MTDKNLKSGWASSVRITFSALGALFLIYSLAGSVSATTVSFSSPVNYPVGTGPLAVAGGDFNVDGKLDLAVANAGSNNVSLLSGNGDGSFNAGMNYSVGRSPSFVAVGFFDSDLHQDLVVSNSTDGTISILLGNGDGTFQSAVNYNVGQSPQWVAVADFNTDNNLDLAVANHGDPHACNDSTVSILLGKGDGTFQSAPNFEAGPCPFSVAAGDLNADGKLDLVTQADALIGDGNGTFQSPVILNWGSGQGPGPVAVADFNDDGKQDLAGSLTVAEFTRRVKILLGNGDGTFQSAATYNGGLWPVSIAVADFDLNGTLDLATTSVNTTQVSILTGNGDGTFQPPASFAVGPTPLWVATGDFNGDNLPDLVVTNNADNNVSVMLNNTSVSTFVLSVTINGSGMGVVIIHPGFALCAHSCSKSFASGTQVRLGTNPNAGSSFAGWSGACSGTGACNLTLNGDRAVTATFNLTTAPDFSLSALPLSPSTVAAGQSATSTVTVAATGSFNGSVSLICSVQPLPAHAPTCLVSPSSVNPGTDATLTVATMVPNSARDLSSGSSSLVCAIWLPLIGLFAASPKLSVEKQGKRQLLRCLAFSVLLLVIFQSACGGSDSSTGSGGTPAGTYTVTVTGTSGSLQHSAPVTLIVK